MTELASVMVSRYKFDRSLEFIPSYKVGGGHLRSVAVQTISKPEICQVAGFKLRADARVRVQRPLRICLGCRSKSKKCDKQLTFIVRVRWSCLIFCPFRGERLPIKSLYFL
jgi:hypothetical protein